MRKKTGKKPSIATVVTVCFVLVQLVTAGFGTMIASSYVREGIDQANRSRIWFLEGLIAQIDREMDMAASFMNTLIYQNPEAVNLTNRENAAFYYTANHLHNEIRQSLMYDQYISGMYYYVPSTEFEYTWFNDAQTLEMASVIREYILEESIGQTRRDADWRYMEVEGASFLIQGYANNGFFGGCLVNLNKLPLPTESGISIEAQYASLESLDAFGEMKERGVTLLEARSSIAPFGICERIREKDVRSALPFLQRYAFLLLFVMILFMAVFYAFLNHFVVMPLRRLEDAMLRIREGDLDYRIEESSPVREFAQAEKTFNQMIRQIRDLRIEVYEKQLEHQKTQLQNLSYQLRPHFMVNSLNMVYNLILSEDKKNAMKLIRFSIGYLRYLLKKEKDMVPLQEEILHLENYLNIQLLRYEGQFGYDIEIDPFVQEIEIPSMLLQNFVENSIKYSLSPRRFTRIRIRVGYLEKDGIPSALLEVSDNGVGYPDWLLKAVREEDYEALQERIGLKNNLMRMKMLFGERAECTFGNDEGAVVRFIFPIEMERGEGEEGEESF